MEKALYERYYLECKNDNSDMTDEIEKMLEKEGTCLLGSGIYYIKRGINMPMGSSIIGLGASTKLLLDPSVESGYTVKLNSFCMIRSVSVIGSVELLARPDDVGSRHGIVFIGNATHENRVKHPRNAIITCCQINSFSGSGIYCMDTGYNPSCAITPSDCHIVGCGVGINIHHHSEYHEFTNILCFSNLYGCINNGGNNVFLNCGFNSNVTGFVIDNSKGQSINDSHGSMIGCTINHSGSNEGVGLLLLGVQSGYVFSGGQIFYSKIVCDNCSGIHISNFNFGRNIEFKIKGGDPLFLSGSIFATAPIFSLENDANVIINASYTRAGEVVRAG